MRKYQKGSTPPRSLLRFSSNKLGFIRHQLRRSGAGFTLIELLIVIVVAGVLAGIVLLAVNPARQFERARDAGRKQSLSALSRALGYYYVPNGAYPDPGPDLISDSSEGDNWIPGLIPGYLKILPKDPKQAGLPFFIAFNGLLEKIGGKVSDVFAAGCAYPAQILDLTNWKETLPIGSPGIPTEIKQPALDTYAIDPWFVVSTDCNGVQFRAAVDGVIQSGSSYPRSELREMTSNGTANASWSATSGTHTMIIDEAITSLPAIRPHIIAGQIHNATNDVSTFRLEGSNLYVRANNDSYYFLITSSYVLGTRFQGKFVVSAGQIQAYYNGVLQTTIPYSGSGNYFKAGSYTQANCTQSLPCDSSNYGEVNIYNVTVLHDVTPTPTPTVTPTPMPVPTSTPPPSPSPTSTPPPGPLAFKYLYTVTADFQSFTLWAGLENLDDPEIYSKPSAKCQQIPPSSDYNYCVESN